MGEPLDAAIANRQTRLTLTIGAGALIAFWLFPVVWMVSTSFKASP